MSTAKVIVIIGCMLYVLSPIDLIPDVIPVLGWIDDAVVGTIGVITALSSIGKRGNVRRFPRLPR